MTKTQFAFPIHQTLGCVFAALTFVAGLSQRVEATPIVSRNINTYALFAYDQLEWKGGTAATNSGYIYGGDVGVNYPGLSPSGFSLSFGTSARGIMSPGHQAVADSVRADDAQDIFYDLFANTLNVSFGATVVNPNPGTPKGNYPFTTPIIAAASLPMLPFTPGRAATNGASDLTVGGGGGLPSPQTLLPGPFRDVRFNDGTTINLLAGQYDMRNVSIGKNVTINLTNGTILAIDKQFDPNDGLMMGTNPGYLGGAQLLVGGLGDNPSTDRTTNFSHNAEIHVQYFAPNSWLDLGGGNELYGRYWARRITGDPNNNVHMAVPEPASMWLLVTAGAALMLRRRCQ
jgi:PEP-CTERM motif